MNSLYAKFRTLSLSLSAALLLLLNAGCPRVMCDCASPYLKVIYRSSDGTCFTERTQDLIGELYREDNLKLDSFAINPGSECTAMAFLTTTSYRYLRIHSDSLNISDTLFFSKVVYERGERPCECLGLSEATFSYNGTVYVCDSFSRVLP